MNVTLIHKQGTKAYLFKIDLADMATSIKWDGGVSPSEIVKVGELRDVLDVGFSGSLQEFAARAEEKMKSVGYYYRIPVDYVSSENTRAPVKRNKNLRLGTLFSVNPATTEVIFCDAYIDISTQSAKPATYDSQKLNARHTHEIKADIRKGRLVKLENAENYLGMEDGIYLNGRKI